MRNISHLFLARVVCLFGFTRICTTMDVLMEERIFKALSALFGQKLKKFPGTLPVTIDRENQHELRHGFVASLKADGNRNLCILEGNKMRWMKRDKIVITFELTHTFENDFTFDVEWEPKSKMLLLFDTLLFNNINLIGADYLQRISLASHFLNHIVPQAECKSFPQTVITDPCPIALGSDLARCWKTPFCVVQVKPPYYGVDAAKLWNARHQMRYRSDGIIFTRLWCTYKPFSDPNSVSIFKWKPQNTIDFRMDKITSKNRFVPKEVYHSKFDLFHHPDNESDCNVVLSVQDDAQTLFPFTFARVPDAIMLLCKGQVCEFMWNDDQNIWEFQMVRSDKPGPNYLPTVLSCCRSISQNIQIEELVELFGVQS